MWLQETPGSFCSDPHFVVGEPEAPEEGGQWLGLPGVEPMSPTTSHEHNSTAAQACPGDWHTVPYAGHSDGALSRAGSGELAAIDPASSGGFREQLDPLSTGRHLCSRI